MNMKNTPKVIKKQIASNMTFLFCPRILFTSCLGFTLLPFDFLSSSMLTRMKPYVRREMKEQMIFQKHHSSSAFIPLKN